MTGLSLDAGRLGDRPQAERPVIARQVALGLLLFGVYLVVDALETPARRAAALRHGQDLLDLERGLHLDVESSLNAWLAPHGTLATLANYEYAWTYVVSALALVTWVLLRRPDLWGLTRDSFVVLNLLAIGCFALYPTAPPRMLAHEGFVDTVSRGGTVGSWGTGIVDSANQIAAMPSLHVGWALWVSVVLARITARAWVQVVSAIHVLLTVYVVMATANHYLLDAVAVALPVVVGVRVAVRAAERRERDAVGTVVPACDAFFLHVEETGAPQHVGGLVLFAAGPDEEPALDAVRELARTELAPRVQLRRRLAPLRRWRRPRWVDAEVDLDRHVVERRSTDGLRGLWALVAELAEQPLPRDQPLWRVVLVRDVGPGRSALLFLVHHAVADGVGTVAHALSLFRPRVGLSAAATSGPGAVQRAAAVVAGLAQLATDGGAPRLPPASLRRDFAAAQVDLDAVRAAARARGVRVSDLLLALVGEAVAVSHPDLAARVGGTLRISATQLLQAPGQGTEGNATAAVMVDVPVDARPFDTRLAGVARATARRRTPTRALASRFVMTTGQRMLPEPAARWFARSVYGRRFLHGVVSNLPGPVERLTMAGAAVDEVYPVLPVAPGTVLSVGALGWGGDYGIGVASDPALCDAARLVAHLERLVAGLGTTPAGGPTGLP